MSPRQITGFRWMIVAAYGLFGFGLSFGGITAGKFVAEVVVGVVCLVAIVSADWVAAGRRDDD